LYPTKNICRVYRFRKTAVGNVGFENPTYGKKNVTGENRSPRYDVHRRGKRPSENGRSNFAETSAVISAQAGIQTSAFRKYFKAAAISNFWIPACAEMTGGQSRV